MGWNGKKEEERRGLICHLHWPLLIIITGANQSVTFRFQNFSVSKLFNFFLIVLDSVSKKFGIGKSFRFGIGKNLVSKKVSDSVSERFGIEKSIGFGIGNYLVSKKVSDSVSEIFGIGKKIRIRFRSDFGYRHTLWTSVASKSNFDQADHVAAQSNFLQLCKRMIKDL